MLKYLAILLPLLLSSCSMFDERIVVKTEAVYLPIVCPDPAKPAQITVRKIRPKVIEDKIGIFWIAMTPSDYGNLAINTQETIRYIKDKHGVVEYYRACIADFNSKLDELESSDPPNEP